MRIALAAAALWLAGCGSDSASSPSPRDAGAAAPRKPAPKPAPDARPAKPAAIGACGDDSRREILADGLELLTLVPTRAPAVAVRDRCIRVLRADPAHYRVEVGAAGRDGGERTAPRWAELRGAAGVINASMFHDGGDSTGLLVDRGKTLADKVNPKFGAFLAANPRKAKHAAVQIWGRGCPGGSIEHLRRNYGTVVQNYRMLDCDRRPIHWADDKIYSSAAVGVDRAGRVLFIHLRAPYKMSDVTEMLADPALGLDLAGAMYVEGGPEATLFVRSGDRRALFVGSYETRFKEDDENARAWELPNVLMIVPR